MLLTSTLLSQVSLKICVLRVVHHYQIGWVLSRLVLGRNDSGTVLEPFPNCRHFRTGPGRFQNHSRAIRQSERKRTRPTLFVIQLTRPQPVEFTPKPTPNSEWKPAFSRVQPSHLVSTHEQQTRLVDAQHRGLPASFSLVKQDIYAGQTVWVLHHACFGPERFWHRSGTVLAPFWHRPGTVLEPFQNRARLACISERVLNVSRTVPEWFWNQSEQKKTGPIQFVSHGFSTYISD